jgi:hypothetical protein
MITKEFNSLESFSKHLNKMIGEYPRYEKKWGDFSAEVLEKEAKDKIGHLQPNWKELAEVTKRQKERLGYVFNADYNPLFREGHLRDSIKGHYNLANHSLMLGSFSEIMVYQALGTANIPPRDVIGSTMMQAKPQLVVYLGQMLMAWMLLQSFRPRRATYGNI